MADEIICGDCRELLAEWPDASFDAVITDPPYGIGAYKGDSKKVALVFPEVLPELHRVLRPGGALAFFGRWPTYARWQVAAEDCEFAQREEVIRDLGQTTGRVNGSLNRIHESCYIGYVPPYRDTTFEAEELREPLVCLRRPWRARPEKWSTVTKGMGKGMDLRDRGHNPKGAWPRSIQVSSRRPRPRLHTFQKPLADCEWLVKLLTNEGDSVLDPFCGAGTIPLACANLGRRYVGIDVEEKWVVVSQQRIADETKREAQLELTG